MSDVTPVSSLRDHGSTSSFARVADACLSRWHAHLAEPDTDDPTGVDLRDADALNLEIMLLALATIAERARDQLPVHLRLPVTRRGRDRLRRWRFQETCEAAAGSSLRRLVAPADRHWFNEGSANGNGASVDSELARFALELERHCLLALASYRLGEPGALTRMIRCEWSRWRHPLVLQLLNDHAHGFGPDVARVLVHELLANAIQHPDASLAVVGASLEDPAGSNPVLLIGLWDDGKSLIETLGEHAARGLRARPAAEVADVFYVRADGWTARQERIPADWDPCDATDEAELLIASLLPGISRKPHVDTVAVDRPEPVEWEQHVGFGLHALYRYTVDVFRGALSIRTGSYLLELAAATEDRGEKAYDVYVRHCTDSPPLLGTIVTLHLPLTH